MNLPKVKQACDCCHARKIRCDGPDVIPCHNCRASAIQCTYNTIPKKKGPRGPSKKTPKAILQMQLRMCQDQPKSPEDHIYDTTSSPSLRLPSERSSSSVLSDTLFVPSPLLSLETALQYVDVYFKDIYTISPFLHREHLYTRISSFRTSAEIYALISSLCAAIISRHQTDKQLFASSELPFPTGVSMADFFIAEAKRARSFHEYFDKPATSDICTSFFLFSAMSNLERHNSAWFYLREAVTMSQVLGLDQDEMYLETDELDVVFNRRVLWILFISDRSYTLQKHRPLSVYHLTALPAILPDDPEAPILHGLYDLISLFQHFDDKFITLWNCHYFSSPNSIREDNPDLALQLVTLQSTLSASIPEIMNRSEIQQSGILITCQWLKTIVWQLCLAKGLLSSSSEDSSMSFYYPITIARDVAASISVLKKESFEPYGPSILEKVFDIGCSLVDVLLLHPSSSIVMASNMEVGPQDYLMEMIKLCSTVLGGSTKYFHLLLAKSRECLPIDFRSTITSVDKEVFKVDENIIGSDGEMKSASDLEDGQLL